MIIIIIIITFDVSSSRWALQAALGIHAARAGRDRGPTGTADQLRLSSSTSLGWHYLSNAACLIRPRLFSTALL